MIKFKRYFDKNKTFDLFFVEINEYNIQKEAKTTAAGLEPAQAEPM